MNVIHTAGDAFQKGFDKKIGIATDMAQAWVGQVARAT